MPSSVFLAFLRSEIVRKAFDKANGLFVLIKKPTIIRAFQNSTSFAVFTFQSLANEYKHRKIVHAINYEVKYIFNSIQTPQWNNSFDLTYISLTFCQYVNFTSTYLLSFYLMILMPYMSYMLVLIKTDGTPKILVESVNELQFTIVCKIFCNF